MSQQGLRQASVRAVSGTTLSYEGDWHAMWDLQTIAAGNFNERMIAYCGQKLATTFTNVNDAMQALAVDAGATNFGSMGTFDASIGPTYEAETVTLLAAMTPAPDDTRKGHINTLIAALKSGGVWTKLDLLYILAAHSAAPARLNWKAPATFAATAVNSPTFTVDRGYTGDGATSYLTTGFDPATHGVTYTRNSAHMGVWSRTNAAGLAPIGFDTGYGHVMTRYTDDKIYLRVNTGDGSGIANTNSSGLIIGDRPDAGNVFAYRNGSSLGSESAFSIAITAGTLRIGGAPTTWFSSNQIAAASAGGTMSAGEHTAYYNAMAAYMTAVGA